MSLFLACTIAYLESVRARRWTAVAVAAFLAGLAYPIGVMVLPIVGVIHVGRTTRRLVPTALAALPPLLAFGVVLLVQKIQTGRWTAFFDVQQHYGHGVHDPFLVTWNYVVHIGTGWGSAPYWQTLFVSVVLVLLVLLAGRRDPLLLTYAIVAWAAPLTQANVSVWRSQDALLPVAPLVGRLPRALATAIVAGAVIVGVAVARLFFEGGLV